MMTFATGFDPRAFDAGEPDIGEPGDPGEPEESWSPVGPVALTLSVTLKIVAAPEYNAPPASGGMNPDPGAGYTGIQGAVWAPIVTVGGEDVSARCLGPVQIIAREGAARVAEFTLRPASGERVSLAGWVGQPVTLSVAAKNPDGTIGASHRLFTGMIDTPAPHLEDRNVAVSATDDLQGVIDAMSDAEIDALVGGRWSAVVFDAAASHGHRRAQDRLSTRPASLDLDVFRVPRITPWARATQPLALGANDIETGSLTVSVAARSQLVNQVDIAFDYRYPRLQCQGYGLSYAYGGSGNGGWKAYISAGNWVLTRQAVESAISSTGATATSITWAKIPDPFVEGNWIWGGSKAADQLCRGFSCLCSFDYAKYNEEAHRIMVACPSSIEKMGVRATSLQSSLEGAYIDPQQYEVQTFMVKSKTNQSVAPTDKVTPMSGITRAQNATLSPETNRSAAEAAMTTLIDIGKTMIAASHRGSQVGFVVPIHPGIDLSGFVTLTTETLTACGKVVALTHNMYTESGRAVTEVTLAISSLSGVGIDHPETATVPPPPDQPANKTLQAHPVITWNSGLNADHSFTITFPGVEEAERALTHKEIKTAYAAPVIEDLFELGF